MSTSTKQPIKVRWSGEIIALQPRIRIRETSTNLCPQYLGFNLQILGDLTTIKSSRISLTDSGAKFLVAITPEAMKSQHLEVGDMVTGLSFEVADPHMKIAKYNKTRGLKVQARGKTKPSKKPPYSNPTPTIDSYLPLTLRPLGALAYRRQCSKCLLGMAAHIGEGSKHWCAGPADCALYKRGRHPMLEPAKKTETQIQVIQRGSRPAMIDKQKDKLRNLHDEMASTLNLSDCPTDYAALKLEAKYLAALSGYAYVVMAQRLTKIRDEQLYREDGYNSFQSFVEAELSIARSTVYNYIDIFGIFGDFIGRKGSAEQYSKLIPTLPLLRTEHLNVPLKQLKTELWRSAKTKTVAEMRDKVSALKERYSVRPEREDHPKSLANDIDRFKKKIPNKPNKKEKQLLEDLRKYLEEICDYI